MEKNWSSKSITRIMISLADNTQCCGCEACRSICPTNSIAMQEDNEGFLQPHIDITSCISCQRCENTCPKLSRNNTFTSNQKTQSLRCTIREPTEELLEVSSGGAYWDLTKTVLDHSGIVYGACLVDLDNVKHVRVDNISDATKLRRSKYLPSSIDGVYEKVKTDLDSGTICLIFWCWLSNCRTPSILAEKIRQSYYL